MYERITESLCYTLEMQHCKLYFNKSTYSIPQIKSGNKSFKNTNYLTFCTCSAYAKLCILL